MKVLIFGGTGFVGRHLVSACIKSGHEVALFVHTKKLDFNGKIRFFEGDILDQESVRRAFEFSPDVVVNLVGIIREFPQRGITFENMHFQAAVNIIDVAKDLCKRTICVQMSANGVESGKNLTDYFKYKYMAEEYLRHSGLKCVIIRPSIIIGKGAGLVRDLAFPLSMGIFPLPHIDKKYAPVDVDVVARRIVESFETFSGEGNCKILHVCGSVEMTFKELIEYIANILGKKVVFVPVPLTLFKLVSVLGDKFSIIPLSTPTFKMLLNGNVCPK